MVHIQVMYVYINIVIQHGHNWEMILKEKLQLETQLVAGGRGAFEVFAEDQLLFSKLNEGRFPEEQEMVDLLR